MRLVYSTLLVIPALALAAPFAARALSDPGESPTMGARPPADALVLFDGSDFSAWRQRDGAPSGWKVQEDGSVLVEGQDAVTEQPFADFQLHLEFFCPKTNNEGQARSNSGVYLHGRYEVQVLDSYGDHPEMNNCGAIYSIAVPLVNASRPGGNWQTYDVIFRAPRFSGDTEVEEHARVTILLNGIVIHNNLELPHTTPGGLDEEVVRRGPVLLQNHGDPVRYRNIWVRPL